MTTNYQDFDKKQLEIFCHNKDLTEERDKNKIFLLTGCHTFGDLDGMNGSCIECAYENPNLFDRCHYFKFALKDYLDYTYKRKVDES